MSQEVAKKRGRPKKIVPESTDDGIVDSAKKVTKRKISAKAATPKATISAAEDVEKPKPAARTRKAIAKVDIEPETAPLTANPIPILTPSFHAADSAPLPLITPANSKILSQVRELETSASDSRQMSYKPTAVLSSPTPSKPKSSPKPTTSTSTNKTPVKAASPSPPKPATKSKTPASIPVQKAPPTGALSANKLSPKAQATAVPEPPKPAQIPRTTPPASPAPVTKPAMPMPSQASTPKVGGASPSQPTPPPQPRPSIASVNSNIVSEISARAGARPSASAKTALPKNYNSVARKVTMAIVAMPIAIVTSYVLYERLVLGQERKHLVKPGLVMVENSSDEQGSPSK